MPAGGHCTWKISARMGRRHSFSGYRSDGGHIALGIETVLSNLRRSPPPAHATTEIDLMRCWSADAVGLPKGMFLLRWFSETTPMTIAFHPIAGVSRHFRPPHVRPRKFC